jgi:hypothetical protein
VATRPAVGNLGRSPHGRRCARIRGSRGLTRPTRPSSVAEEWQRLHYDAGVFFRGVLLTVTQKWRERHAEDLNVLEQAFLDASVALQHQEEAQERQRLADEQAHLRALAHEQTRRAEEQASATKRLRGTEGDWLRAAHFFARIGVLTSDLSEVKNAILYQV